MTLVIGEVFRFKPDPALFEVYVQDFKDDYHHDKFPEEEREVRNIKGGTYRDFYEYLQVKEIYDNYMMSLKLRYPKDIYKRLVKKGKLGIYIPTKPEYKAKHNEKSIAAAYEEGIYISKSNDEVDEDLADEFIYDFWDENDVDFSSESLLKASKDDRKLIDKIIIKDYFNDTGYKKDKKKDREITDVDLLSDIYLINSKFDNKGKKKKKDIIKGKPRVGIKLHRYISGEYIKDIEKAEKEDLKTVRYYDNGIMMSGRDQKDMEIYDLMMKGGHTQVYQIIRQRRTKNAKRMSKIYKKQRKLKNSKDEFNSLMSSVLNDSGGNTDHGNYIDLISSLYNREI